MYTKIMSRNKIEFILGALLIILPALGLPTSWKNIFYVLIGALLIIFSIIGHFKRRSRIFTSSSTKTTEDMFVEHVPQAELERSVETARL